MRENDRSRRTRPTTPRAEAIYDEAFFPAASGGPVYSGTLKRWTGAAWVKEPLRVFVSGGWQTKALRRWAGSAWALVDTTEI